MLHPVVAGRLRGGRRVEHQALSRVAGKIPGQSDHRLPSRGRRLQRGLPVGHVRRGGAPLQALVHPGRHQPGHVSVRVSPGQRAQLHVPGRVLGVAGRAGLGVSGPGHHRVPGVDREQPVPVRGLRVRSEGRPRTGSVAPVQDADQAHQPGRPRLRRVLTGRRPLDGPSGRPRGAQLAGWRQLLPVRRAARQVRAVLPADGPAPGLQLRPRRARVPRPQRVHRRLPYRRQVRVQGPDLPPPVSGRIRLRHALGDRGLRPPAPQGVPLHAHALAAHLPGPEPLHRLQPQDRPQRQRRLRALVASRGW